MHCLEIDMIIRGRAAIRSETAQRLELIRARRIEDGVSGGRPARGTAPRVHWEWALETGRAGTVSAGSFDNLCFTQEDPPL